MFLWNILFDPREILDLIQTVGLSKDQATVRLIAALKGAMAGWSEDRSRRSEGSGADNSDADASADSSRAVAPIEAAAREAAS
jgi:hypothetical protein